MSAPANVSTLIVDRSLLLSLCSSRVDTSLAYDRSDKWKLEGHERSFACVVLTHEMLCDNVR